MRDFLLRYKYMKIFPLVKVTESGRMFYGMPGFFLKATLELKGHATKTHRHDPYLEIDFLNVNKITFFKQIFFYSYKQFQVSKQ